MHINQFTFWSQSIKCLSGMKPVNAIKETLVEQGFSQPAKEYEEKLLNVGTKVRYLYESGELEGQIYKGERRKRSTDPIWSVDVSLRKPKVFALQILQRYLTKEGRVRKFLHCLYGEKNLTFENLKGSNVRNFLGFRKLMCIKSKIDTFKSINQHCTI